MRVMFLSFENCCFVISSLNGSRIHLIRRSPVVLEILLWHRFAPDHDWTQSVTASLSLSPRGWLGHYHNTFNEVWKMKWFFFPSHFIHWIVSEALHLCLFSAFWKMSRETGIVPYLPGIKADVHTKAIKSLKGLICLPETTCSEHITLPGHAWERPQRGAGLVSRKHGSPGRLTPGLWDGRIHPCDYEDAVDRGSLLHQMLSVPGAPLKTMFTDLQFLKSSQLHFTVLTILC